ncbi:hypothetical protein H8I91_13325 [Serratia fonticola]|uniref:hypothetical protein n=1 Tax=Serratia fonticola TaxID=47917 RepID=UPI001644ADAD|nr:hypothetical protein [Serratia fonticola]MBC3251251.1 hypothetical protein [Serratia fonticola]
MAILLTTGLTERDYYTKGGVLEYELDALEVGGGSADFESFHSLQPYLKHNAGFELPPSVIIHDPAVLIEILRSTDSWTKLTTYTYAKGGKVVYTRISPGIYRARCEW